MLWSPVILEDPGAVSRAKQSKLCRNVIVAKKVFAKTGKCPWETSFSRPFPNASKNWLLIEQKSPLYYSAQSANSIFRVAFVCSYAAFVLSAII